MGIGARNSAMVFQVGEVINEAYEFKNGMQITGASQATQACSE